MGVYHLRRYFGNAAGMAHIPVKRKVRDTRVNEIVRTQKPPFPYHQPKSHIPIIPFKTSIEMRNILKATTLENKFPLFTVENGCIVSKDADITVAFRVELPELFTVTAAEYEAIHSVNSYRGKDRAFILRFINDGTEKRTAYTKNRSKNNKTANRGEIRGMGFFSVATGSMQEASKRISLRVADLIAEVAEGK